MISSIFYTKISQEEIAVNFQTGVFPLQDTIDMNANNSTSDMSFATLFFLLHRLVWVYCRTEQWKMKGKWITNKNTSDTAEKGQTQSKLS